MLPAENSLQNMESTHSFKGTTVLVKIRRQGRTGAWSRGRTHFPFHTHSKNLPASLPDYQATYFLLQARDGMGRLVPTRGPSRTQEAGADGAVGRCGGCCAVMIERAMEGGWDGWKPERRKGRGANSGMQGARMCGHRQPTQNYQMTFCIKF